MCLLRWPWEMTLSCPCPQKDNIREATSPPPTVELSLQMGKEGTASLASCT